MLPDDDEDFDWAFLLLFLELLRMESFQIELSLRQSFGLPSSPV
jgi:hypothetical protein